MKLAEWVSEYRAFTRDPLGVLQSRVGTTPIYEFRFGPTVLGGHFVVVNTPELASEILRAPNHEVRKSVGYRRMQELLGRGLLTSFDEQWISARKVAQAGVDPRRNGADFLQVIDQAAHRLHSKLQGAKRVDISSILSRTTLDIAARCFLGVELLFDTSRFLDNVNLAQSTIIERAYGPIDLHRILPWYTWTPHRRRIRAIRSWVADMIATPAALRAARQLREATKEWPPRDRLSFFTTLLLAGYETTSNALTWSLMLLGRRRDLQEAICTGLDGGLPRRVFLEALRLYPPAWIIDREVMRARTIGGITVFPKSIVACSPYLLQRNERVWDKPDAFDPERFGDGTPLRDVGRGFIPFGDGPGWCVGAHFALMEAERLISAVCRAGPFSVAVEPNPDPGVTLRPDRGLILAFEA